MKPVVRDHFKCNICDETFETEIRLEEHRNISHFTKCALCDQRFPRDIFPTEHFKCNHAQCNHCARWVVNEWELAEHIRTNHMPKN